MSEELEALQRNRDLILLTEVVGWLHDVDKLDENHQVRVGKKPVRHTRRASVELGFEDASTSDDDIVDLDEEIKSKFHTDICVDFTDLLYGFDKPAIGTPLFRHHSDNPPCNVWETIFAHLDSKDSKEDRSDVSDREYCSGYISNPFGFERKIEFNLREKRKKLYEVLANNAPFNDNYYTVKKILQEYLSLVVADTRRSANDISLWDHGFMTGVMSKCVLLDVLFQAEQGKWFLQRAKEYVDLQEKMRKLPKKERKNVSKEISRIGRKIKEETRFRSLLVTFNGIPFLTNIYRLSDLIGREYILTEIKEAIKELLETEIPIGSTIYEGINTLTFLVPELNNDAWEKLRVELENKLSERIFSILRNNLELSDLELANLVVLLNPFFLILSPEKEVAKLMVRSILSSRGIIVAKEFSEINIASLQLLSKAWKIKKDRCQVCGLLPASEEDRGDRICKSCYVLRSWGRFKTKEEKRELVKKGRMPVSIWLDEIKDENNLLALVVGKVSPIEEWLKPNGYIQNSTYINKNKKKNLSASRARAIWRTIDKFCESCTILPENIVEEAYGCIWEFNESTIQNLPVEIKSELERNPNIDIIFDENRIQAYLHYSTKKIETIVGLNGELAEKLSKISELNIEFRKSRFKIEVSRAEVKHFCKYRPVYSHAGELALLVPANRAFEICRRIKAKFGEEFDKVLGRLTLSLGIIYFKHKMPLYVVLESGRRMLDNFYKLSNEKRELSVKNVKKVSTGYELTMLYTDKELNWIIRSKFPDGEDDIYYPYLFMRGEGEPKHVSEISENDVLRVHLNYFDYEYLTSSQNRFNIIPHGETKKRWHPIFGSDGPRPYLIEDIEKIIELWDILNERLTRTQIKKLEYICASKIEEWELESKNLARDPEFKEFVVSSVENICRKLSMDDKRIIISSILSGMFFDVIELFMTLKSEIGGEQDGQTL